MATLRHGRTFGILQFEKKEYRVCNRPLSKSLMEKYAQYIKKPQTIIETLWMLHKCKWEVRENRLYLTEMFQTHLLRKFTDSEEVLATWVDKLLFHRVTEMILSSKSILRKENVYYTELRFKNAQLLAKKLKVSTAYGKDMEIRGIFEATQLGIFTFDREDIFLKDKKLIIKGDDELIPHLQKDINAMLKKSHKGINLNMEDMKTVLQKASKVTYLCDVVSKNKNMNNVINRILDRVKVITDASSVNYLVYIDMDEGFDFEVMKAFMERMYDMCDDSHVIIGFNERKKKKKPKKKEDIFDERDEVPSHVFIKVLMGVS